MLTMVSLMLLAAEPVKVSVGVFRHVGYPAAVGDVYVGHLAALLSAQGLTVTTQADVEQLVGLERQRELLGCDETSINCAIELAGALGAEAIVTGSIAKTGEGFLVNVRFLSPKRTTPIASAVGRLATEPLLLAWLEEQARELTPQVEDAIDTIRDGARRPTSPLVKWLPVFVGTLSFIGGGISYGLSYGDRDIIVRSAAPLTETAAISRGQLRQDLGVGLMIGGGICLVASLLWNLLPHWRRAGGVAQFPVSASGLAWSFQ